MTWKWKRRLGFGCLTMIAAMAILIYLLWFRLCCFKEVARSSHDGPDRPDSPSTLVVRSFSEGLIGDGYFEVLYYHDDFSRQVFDSRAFSYGHSGERPCSAAIFWDDTGSVAVIVPVFGNEHQTPIIVSTDRPYGFAFPFEAPQFQKIEREGIVERFGPPGADVDPIEWFDKRAANLLCPRPDPFQ